VQPLTADLRDYLGKDSLVRSSCNITFTGNGYSGLNLREVGWIYQTNSPMVNQGSTYAMAGNRRWSIVSWSPCTYNKPSDPTWTDINHYVVRCVRQPNSTAPTGIEATNTYVASGRSTTLTATGATLGGSFVSYQWSADAGFSAILSASASYTPAPTATTTYHVRVLDAGGVATPPASITITVGACPYTGSDLVAGSCVQRPAGAQNWEARIADARVPGAADMGTGAAGTPGASRRVYRIVQMPAGVNGQKLWWLAHNLSYVPAAADNASWLYPNGEAANHTAYGLLYRQQDEYLCPAGWRAPQYLEWKKMLECVDGSCAGNTFGTGHQVEYGVTDMRAKLGATTPQAVGSDSYGFSWLYTGMQNGGLATYTGFGVQGDIQRQPPAQADNWYLLGEISTKIFSHTYTGRSSHLSRRCVRE
jgi:uncharacterized protein (TIGR02145 family)